MSFTKKKKQERKLPSEVLGIRPVWCKIYDGFNLISHTQVSETDIPVAVCKWPNLTETTKSYKQGCDEGVFPHSGGVFDGCGTTDCDVFKGQMSWDCLAQICAYYP